MQLWNYENRLTSTHPAPNPPSVWYNNSGHNNTSGYNHKTSTGTVTRNDWWFANNGNDCAKDATGLSKCTNNIHLSGSITPASEQAEFTLWQQKISNGAIIIGPVGNTLPTPTNVVSTSVPLPTSTTTPTSIPAVPGDINNDRMVDGLDYDIWHCEFLNVLGITCISPRAAISNGHNTADLNGDGIIDLLDFNLWKMNLP